MLGIPCDSFHACDIKIFAINLPLEKAKGALVRHVKLKYPFIDIYHDKTIDISSFCNGKQSNVVWSHFLKLKTFKNI
jgi:hypothetical protein